MTVDPARRETSETAPVVADATTTEGTARGSALWPYWIVRNLAVGFSRLYFRVSYEGLDFVPKAGAFILAPVHRSNVDTLVVAGVTKRRMRFLGKAAMWKFRLSAAFFDAMGGIKVNRGTTDRESMRACVDTLAAGEPVVVYPEGRRQSGPVVQEIFDGAAYMAAKVGVPIIPVAIGGSELAMGTNHKFPRPTKIHVIVGPPIVVSVTRSRREQHELSARLYTELQRLFDHAQATATQ